MNALEILFLEIAGTVVLLDFISGFAKAVYTHSVASSKMRDGLFHKFAYVLVVAICILFDYAQAKVDLGTHVPLVLIACDISSSQTLLVSLRMFAHSTCRLRTCEL